jgi:hypothetical protein
VLVDRGDGSKAEEAAELIEARCVAAPVPEAFDGAERLPLATGEIVHGRSIGEQKAKVKKKA